MKNNFFTHKFLSIVGVFLLVAFSLCTSCFASATTYELPYFSDNDSFIITRSHNDGSFAVYCYSDCYCNGVTSDGKIQFYCSAGSTVDIYSFNEQDFAWKYVRTSNNSIACYDTVNTSYYSVVYINNIVNSSLCPVDDCDVVFQGAPQVEEVPKVELMKATQVEEIPQQIVAIVMIVLPIFLAIFGVLLVLYLIKSKNLLQL